METISILILDDEPRIREEIAEHLGKNNNFLIYEAGIHTEAFEILKKEEIDIAIIDVKLPEIDGIEILKRIKKEYNHIEVIMISGHGDIHTVIEAFRNGASNYFPKPFRLVDTENAIKSTVKFIQLQKQIDKNKTTISLLEDRLFKVGKSPIIGSSKKIKEITELMNLIAKAPDTSVLILGESGTGKELVAHGIHALSDRKDKPFCSVNCSAITDALFESDFFGHNKGAFTDAIEPRQGYFEYANKGTVFLDEICDMPLSQQAKLLRALQDRKVRRLGSNREIEFDVRVIAATNQSIKELANNKKFRADLYHRLSTITVELPPLRERKEDIPEITNYYIRFFTEKSKRNITSITQDALNLLEKYHFPGNVRELANIIERAIVLCKDGEKIDTQHLKLDSLTDNIIDAETQNSFDLLENEKKLILKALQTCNYNKAHAAKLLNISWQTLDRKIEKFNLI